MDKTTFGVRFCGQDIQCFYVTDASTATKFIQKLMEKDVLFGLDTETKPLPEYEHKSQAALSPHLARVRLLQIFDGVNSYVFDIDHIGADRIELFREFLVTKRFIAHNAMFDMGMIKATFKVKCRNMGCTRILYRIISHAVFPTDAASATLEALCEAILKTPLPKAAQKSDWSEPNLSFEQVEYSAIDPVAVLKIAEKLAHNIPKLELNKTYQLSKAVQHPLVEMQMNGMLLDVKKHYAKLTEWGEDLWNARQEVLRFTGLEKVTDAAVGKWLEKNLSAEEAIIWPRTETGKFSTSAHAFSEFSYLPIVKPIAVFKKLDKLSSSFGSSLLNMRNPATGRVHTSFNIVGARTGRLSSSRPNLQQYPNDEELRSHFVATPGKVIVCADYSQIEVRVAAEISQDMNMLRVYRDGLDIYSSTGAHISGKPISAIDKKSRERQIAKALVLGLLFGLGAAKFSHYAKKGYAVDVSLDEATQNILAFRKLYSTFRDWQMKQARMCKDTLFVRTVGGKGRKLDVGGWYGPGLNHPVQGSAAEIIFHALVKLNQDFQGTDVKLLNCVHDEIVSECPANVAEDVAKLKEVRMIEAYRELFPGGIVRGLVNISVGNSWGEAKPG